MKENFTQLFDRDFDVHEPSENHLKKFEARLKAQHQPATKKPWSWIGIAASIVLLLGVWLGQNIQTGSGLELADVSPQMEETQVYFASLISTEIEKINSQKTPENQKIIDDAFKRLEHLELQYANLTIELKNSDSDKRVIFAMVSNFQQRVEVLQNVLEQLNELDLIKTTDHETVL